MTSRTGKARAVGPSSLLREERDLESAEAFFEQAIKRRGVVPVEFITDKHRAYLRAVRQHAPEAKHRHTGLHRKRVLTTKPRVLAHSRQRSPEADARLWVRSEQGSAYWRVPYWLKR